jgi:hypothetical protein
MAGESGDVPPLDDLEEPKGPGIGLPPGFKRRVWAAAIALMLLGAAVSVFWQDWSWLARTGALITVLTLFVSTFDIKSLAAFVFGPSIDEVVDVAAIRQSIHDEMHKAPHRFGIGRQLTEQQFRDVIEQERLRRRTRLRDIFEEELRADLAKLGLMLGSIGTLLWGFADLLPKCW